MKKDKYFKNVSIVHCIVVMGGVCDAGERVKLKAHL